MNQKKKSNRDNIFINQFEHPHRQYLAAMSEFVADSAKDFVIFS